MNNRSTTAKQLTPLAASYLFGVHNQRGLASPSKTLSGLALQGWKMGEIILAVGIHQLRHSQHVINFALTPCSSGVTFKIQYSAVWHFPPAPSPVSMSLSLNCLLNKFGVIGHQGTPGDLWHIVELLHLNPISPFFPFFPPFPFVLLNCQVIARARTALFAGRDVLESVLLTLATSYH